MLEQHRSSVNSSPDDSGPRGGSPIASTVSAAATSAPSREERYVAAIRALGLRIDNKELPLRKGRSGGVHVKGTCKDANVPLAAAYGSDAVAEAIQELKEGREFAETPPRVRRDNPSVATMLARLDKLAAALKPADRLPTTPDGRLCKPSLAKLANLPEKQWIGVKAVEKRMELMALEHLLEGATQPDADLPVEEVVARLDQWDVLLAMDGSRVPSIGGKPSLGASAPGIGVSAPTIASHPAAVARFVDIAKARGLERIPAARTGKSQTDVAVDRIGDHFDWLLLRGEMFPQLPGGGLDYPRLLTRLGLNPDLVIKPGIRSRMKNLDATLRRKAGHLVDDQVQHLQSLMAVADRYELHVLAGLQAVPLDKEGLADLRGIERLFEFGPGSTKRFPELATRLSAIHAPGTGHDAAAMATLTGDTLACLGEYRRELEDKKGRLHTGRQGLISHAAIERHLFMREGTIAAIDAAVRAVEQIAESVGTGKSEPGVPADQMTETLVKKYAAAIQARGFGPPRLHRLQTDISKETVARDMSVTAGRVVSPSELTSRHMAMIRSAADGVIAGRFEPDASVLKQFHTCTDEAVGLLEAALASFGGPLPADPLTERLADYAAIARRSGIDVKTLIRIPAFLTMIDDWTLKVGLRPFSMDVERVTYDQLEKLGRVYRADETKSIHPDQAIARSVGFLTDVRMELGLSPSDEVLDGHLTVSAAMKDAELDSAEHQRWRRYLSWARHDASLPKDFGSALKVGMRLKGMDVAALTKLAQAELDARDKAGELSDVLARNVTSTMLKSWVTGRTEPAHLQQPIVDVLETLLALPGGLLTGRLGADHRPIRTRPREGGYEIPNGYGSLVPIDFHSREPRAQKAILVWLNENVRNQNSEYSRRQKVASRATYRLDYTDWPAELKAEWRAFVKSRRRADGLDLNTELAPDRERRKKRGRNGRTKRDTTLSLGTGATPYRRHLERFFGFLVNKDTIDGGEDLIPAGTPEPLREAALASAHRVGWKRAVGLGLRLDQLSLSLVAFGRLYQAWAHFHISRCNGESSTQLAMANLFRHMVKKGGFVRTSDGMRAKALEFELEWRSPSEQGASRPFGLGKRSATQEKWSKLCKTTELYLEDQEWRLWDRIKGRNGEKKLAKRRDPFLPVRPLLKSKKPLAWYRKAIQGMLGNRPSRLQDQHIWLRDCVLTLILFQSLLRIKNLAKLTYRKDGSGQLYKQGGAWFLKIHKDNFKNKHGEYFIDTDYFEFPLADQDGLYKLLDEYVDRTRPILLAKLLMKDIEGDDGEEEGEGEDAADPDYEDDLADFDDGERDEDRLFIGRTGNAFAPATLSARYRGITIRYLVHNPHRNRGVQGIMPHGPHTVRHLGATDTLIRTGSYAEAARVIQDAERTARNNYTEFDPLTKGGRSATILQAGRDVEIGKDEAVPV